MRNSFQRFWKFIELLLNIDLVFCQCFTKLIDVLAFSSGFLFFIYYLNDVDSGGETEFKFNPLKVNPEVGKLVIAPALWTHKHRGNPPQNGQYKYIITGWIEKKDEHYISEEFEEDYLI